MFVIPLIWQCCQHYYLTLAAAGGCYGLITVPCLHLVFHHRSCSIGTQYGQSKKYSLVVKKGTIGGAFFNIYLLNWFIHWHEVHLLFILFIYIYLASICASTLGSGKDGI